MQAAYAVPNCAAVGSLSRIFPFSSFNLVEMLAIKVVSAVAAAVRNTPMISLFLLSVLPRYDKYKSTFSKKNTLYSSVRYILASISILIVLAYSSASTTCSLVGSSSSVNEAMIRSFGSCATYIALMFVPSITIAEHPASKKQEHRQPPVSIICDDSNTISTLTILTSNFNVSIKYFDAMATPSFIYFFFTFFNSFTLSLSSSEAEDDNDRMERSTDACSTFLATIASYALLARLTIWAVIIEEVDTNGTSIFCIAEGLIRQLPAADNAFLFPPPPGVSSSSSTPTGIWLINDG
mmetsp:Transcript_20593/g.23762  ORF Transcript_20593/g.23762 Transcript_20593/m.23762 type:complete len:294 (+) Transcript_20593:877-1758(+)